MRPVSGSNSCRRLDLVVEQLDADRHFAVLGREDVDGVAAHAELAAREILSLRWYCMRTSCADHVALAHLVADAQCHHHLVVGLGLANAVDGRHRGHDHHVAPLQHALGADRRICSMCSLMAESFSMNRSRCGT